MRFLPTPLDGLLVVQSEPHGDARGSFTRGYCAAEFAAAGIEFAVAQANVSRSHAAGTLRGLHYQAEPHAEAKLVRCTRGRIFDVAVDLRHRSTTRARWFGLTLTADSGQALFIPEGFAHGFLTLEAECEVDYLMGAPYVAEAARGVRWNDPAFAIAWPTTPRAIAPRDAHYPDYRPIRAPSRLTRLLRRHLPANAA